MSKLISTFFYLGKAPLAPGTVGSLAALFMWAAFFRFVPQWWLQAATLLAFWALAHWAAEKYLEGEKQRGKTQKDPKEIVSDEVLGMGIALFFLPVTSTTMTFAFLFFRIFDITKPKPVGHWEQFSGAKGIMLDDVAAGVLANITVRMIMMWAPSL